MGLPNSVVKMIEEGQGQEILPGFCIGGIFSEKELRLMKEQEDEWRKSRNLDLVGYQTNNETKPTEYKGRFSDSEARR